MSDIIKGSFLLYGAIDLTESNLWNWYQYAYEFSEELGFPPTHIGITANSFKSRKLVNIKRMESKIKTSIEKGEKIECLSVYSLPDEFTQAAFDFDTFMYINLIPEDQFILFTFPKKSFEDIDVENVLNKLKHFINVTEGEVFELSVYESPYLYASRVNPVTEYESLKVITKI